MLKHIAWVGVALAFGCGGKRAGDTGGDNGVTTADAPTASATQDAAETIDPHRKQLESAVKRLAAGRKAFDEGDFGKAMLEAQRGLDALGKDYAGPEVADDTDLKIQAAKERSEQGAPGDGATIMLRMLGERIELARKKWDVMP